ncbi:MAG TPA: glycoside hydrolase family 28 protein [Chitinophagaceae bacterium]|nr:glycoside hydrolase family 28 protein [Chitinophagaceae bacterium]
MKRLLLLLLQVIAFLALHNMVRAQSLPVIQPTQFKKDSFNILQYGAVGNGITLNTKSITAAINACAAKGGGVVLVPAGAWLTGPLVLKSNVNLCLAANALLQFTTDFNQYPLVSGNWEGLPAVRNQSPISAENASNIAITGEGIIDGGGDAWRAVKKEKLTATQWTKLIASGGVLSEDQKTWYPTQKSFKGFQTKDAGVLKEGKTAADFEDIKDFLRPNLLVLTNCKRILLQGISFQNSPAWCLHPLLCEDLTVRNVYVKNPWYAQNGDGIDIESCKNVLLEKNTFDVGDDGICIKSGRDAEGRKRNRPTENVIIRNCIVYHAHGGFVIGSEMSGGARNIFVNDCSFIGTDIGLRFKTTRGRGGVVEKIFIRNINMKDIAGEAILFDMYYMAKDPVPLAGEKRELPVVETKPVDETTPVFRNFRIRNINCNGASKAIFVRGLPEMHVTDIIMQDMVLKTTRGIDLQEASQLTLKNIQLLPADDNPVIDVLQSDNIVFDNIRFPAGAALLLRASGERVKKIAIAHTQTASAKEKVQTTLGAAANAVSIDEAKGSMK